MLVKPHCARVFCALCEGDLSGDPSGVRGLLAGAGGASLSFFLSAGGLLRADLPLREAAAAAVLHSDDAWEGSAEAEAWWSGWEAASGAA